MENIGNIGKRRIFSVKTLFLGIFTYKFFLFSLYDRWTYGGHISKKKIGGHRSQTRDFERRPVVMLFV